MSELQVRLCAIRADEAAIREALDGTAASLDQWLGEMNQVHDLLARAVAAVDKGRKPLISGPAPAPAATGHETALFTGNARIGKPVEEQAAPSATSAEEDAALLASLDPETAEAVQLRRRLFGARKSLREIVDEVRADKKPAAPNPPQQKKGWWS
ncbi:MAG: hypothetical protein HZB38_03695 [Planctomycetes bacterium]|nr:hypothetical protein [Planctomycetota bacterium]